MNYLFNISVIALLTFAEASVLINILDNAERNNLGNELSLSELEPLSTNKLNSCNPISCDYSCHILGFPEGRCKDDICECIYKLNHRGVSKTHHVSDCSPLGCDQSCRRIGFPGGACVNGRCKCDII